MSDLISRKKISGYIKMIINPYGKPFEGTAYELGLKIMRYIDAMESAYDVDKVVGKLEEAKDNVPVNRLLDDIIKEKPKELGQLIAYDKAIEIVKAGVKNE